MVEADQSIANLSLSDAQSPAFQTAFIDGVAVALKVTPGDVTITSITVGDGGGRRRAAVDGGDAASEEDAEEEVEVVSLAGNRVTRRHPPYAPSA